MEAFGAEVIIVEQAGGAVDGQVSGADLALVEEQACAAWRLLAEQEAGATIAFLACDSGLKYLSTDLFP